MGELDCCVFNFFKINLTGKIISGTKLKISSYKLYTYKHL